MICDFKYKRICDFTEMRKKCNVFNELQNNLFNMISIRRNSVKNIGITNLISFISHTKFKCTTHIW